MAQAHLREVKRRAEAFERARAARDRAIFEAHLSGESLRDIARQAKISNQRISVIVRREKQQHAKE